MLKVRLQRVGRKNDPSFRLVVIESTKGPKSRNYIELLGSYNPRQKTVDIKGERVKHWIAQGAQVSDTVHNLLINQKVIEGKKVNVLGKKTPIIDEEKIAKEKEDAEAKEAAKKEAEEKAKAEAEAPTEDPESATEGVEDDPASGDSEATDETQEEPAKEEKPAEEPTPAVEETTKESKEA